MRVDMEEVEEIQKKRKKINDININDLELYHKGKEILISPSARESFDFTGLSTIDFITSRYYKHPSFDEQRDGSSEFKESPT